MRQIFGQDKKEGGEGPAGLGTATPIIVKLKPGTAAEKSLKVLLPQHMAGESIDRIVAYAMQLGEEDGIRREGLRIQERIGVEMRNKYGISVNGQAVRGEEKLSDYLRDATSASGRNYLEAEIIVAARQEGASPLEYSLRGYRLR